MSDHVALNADGLTAMGEFKKLGFDQSREGASSSRDDYQNEWQKHKFSFSDYEEEEEDAEKKECRICQEEDLVKNLEAPCACNGSLKLAHRACIQHWCNEKRGTVCEICKQPYKDGYTISPSVQETILDINDSDGWAEGTLIRSRLFTAVETERLFGINPYDDYTTGDRVKAVIILAILLFSMDIMMIGQAFSLMDDQIVTLISTLFLLYLAMLMLIYVFTWMGSLSCPRQRTRESVATSARLTAIPVAMAIPNSVHRRRVVQRQSESDEDKDSVSEQ